MTIAERPGGQPSSTDDRRRQLAAVLAARRAAPGPLAPNQERLLILQQLEPQSTAYAETVVLRLRGELDAGALLSAVRALPERHEWLRSRIEVGTDGPVQVVASGIDADVTQVDLSADGAAVSRRDLSTEVQTWVRGLAEDPLSLEDGPVWRAGLARLGAEDHLFVLVVHHVACDATSLGVLLDELGQRYDAAVRGTSLQLPRPRSPRDLAVAVRALQSSPAARAAVAGAAAALADADLEARVGTAGGGSRGNPGPVGVVSRRVPQSVARRVDRVAAEHGVTPFAVVCVAIGVALADAEGVDTPVLGVPVDLRWHLDGSADVVSFLVETVAIGLPQLLDQPLVTAAAAVRDAVAAALELPPPFEEVVAELRRAGALPPTGTPLHAYVTWLEDGDQATLGAHGPAVTHVDVPLGQAKFDLSWLATAAGHGLELRLEYDSSRIDAAGADRLVTAVVRLLDLASADVEAPMGRLSLLSDAELAQVRAWEGEAAPQPLVDLFSTVRDGLALDAPVLVAGGETLTGAQLLARVDELAAALLDAGVRPGDRVAVPSRRVPGMVVALLAVLRAGATFLPVDVAHPAARQRDLARAARVVAVVGEQAWATHLADAAGARPVVVDAGGNPEVRAATTPAWPQRGPTDLAYVMFTSGSTGRPKAVRVPDGAVVARIDSYRQVLAEEGVRYLLQSTLTFDASIYLFWVLATGGLLVVPGDDEAADPLALAGLVERHRLTDVFFVPGMYESLLRVARPGALDSFQRLCVGGDVMPPAVAALHHATLPGAALLNVYGPTEVVVTSTLSPILPADVVDDRTMPIGRPHPGTVARVLDRNGRRLPAGAVGELHLGGPSVADGYDRDDGSTGLDGPFSLRQEESGAQLRWYATGDLVRWRDDGRLSYVGRRDRQVKLRGQRVELGEVEAAARRVPGVTDAAVEVFGAGAGQRMVAFVAPEVEGVRAALGAVLPAAWLPDQVITWSELPHLPSGKLDRAVLRDHLAAPSLEPAADHGGQDVRELTGIQRTVLSVVRTLLGDQSVDVDDDFFLVGGNSLLAARLMGELSSLLGVTVPLHELIGNSTLREIADLADRDFSRGTAASREEARLVPIREAGSMPPMVLVARDGATSLVLQHFMARIDTERPLWVLLRPMPPLGYQVPDLVADGAEVARVLRERFPDGPVHLLGHSASGIVTVEAARALGDRRGATILLDTVPPSSWSATPLRGAVQVARVLLHRYRLFRQGVRPPAADDLRPPPRTARAFRLYQDSLASSHARMRPMDLPLTVITSSATREALGRDDIGWGRWASQLELVPVDGDHLSLLLQPDVAETARRIQEVLATWA